MKLLFENWRDYQSQVLYEQELESFFNKHFGVLDEGIMADVINAGRTIKDAIVNVIDDMKDWAQEKIVAFVKFMGQKMMAFIKELRSKGIFKKYQARKEIHAVKLLMTNKHIDLAVMIFTALAKLTGGFAIDKIAQMPEIIKKFKEVLDSPVEGLTGLLGDVSDVVKIIKKFISYREDLNDPALGTQFRNWADYGGLAELLSSEASIIEEKKNPRVPRKKGQPAKSKKHSDLYTDEDPKGTIHGLGYKDEATARASVTKIRNSGRSHAHKTQAAIAMEQRAKAAGKSKEAAIFRKFIEQQKKKTKSKNKKK